MQQYSSIYYDPYCFAPKAILYFSGFGYLAFCVLHSGNEETVKTSGSLQRTEGENIDGKALQQRWSNGN